MSQIKITGLDINLKQSKLDLTLPMLLEDIKSDIRSICFVAQTGSKEYKLLTFASNKNNSMNRIFEENLYDNILNNTFENILLEHQYKIIQCNIDIHITIT